MKSVYHFRNVVASAMFALGLDFSRGDMDAAADLIYESGLLGGPIDIAAVHVLLAF